MSSKEIHFRSALPLKLVWCMTIEWPLKLSKCVFNFDWTVILCQKERLKAYYRNFKKIFRTEKDLLKKKLQIFACAYRYFFYLLMIKPALQWKLLYKLENSSCSAKEAQICENSNKQKQHFFCIFVTSDRFLLLLLVCLFF